MLRVASGRRGTLGARSLWGSDLLLMFGFFRALRPLLDRSAKTRLILAACFAIGIAFLDAVGVALVLPLLQTLDGLQTGAIPESASFVADRITSPTAESVAIVLGGAVIIAFVSKAIGAVVYMRWSFFFLARTEAALATKLMRSYLYAPWTFHLERNSAELLHTANVATRYVFQTALTQVVSAFADVAVIVAIGGVLLFVDPLAAVIAGIYFALAALGYRWTLTRRAADAGHTLAKAERRTWKSASQSLGASKEIAVRHLQEHFADEYQQAREAGGLAGARISLLGMAPRYYLEVALIVGVGIMSAVVFPTRESTEAVGVLAVFLVAGFRLLPSIHRLLAVVTAVRGAAWSMKLIVEDFEELAPYAGSVVVAPTAHPPAPLTLENVSFSYERSHEPVLRDISLTIEPTSSVAFVGLSGAGKTTLLDLLLGLLEPDEGRIVVGGKPMREVRDAWQVAIGYVPQDVVLIDDTIRANIAFGIPDNEVDHDRLLAAIGLAQLDDFVADLPEGLLTQTGEHGVRVSGGQRQRVGIARALYHRPSTLVLDEATSSLDSKTERRITETVEGLHGDLTIITVSHRLSTVRRADTIHYLDAGALVASGTFDELCRDSTAFVHLANLQGLAGPASQG